MINITTFQSIPVLVNLTFIQLSLANFYSSPFLNSRISNIQIQGCVLSRFYNSFIRSDSYNPSKSLLVSKTTFSLFLFSPIYIKQNEINPFQNREFTIPQNISMYENSFQILSCKFHLCKNPSGKGGGIFYLSSPSSNRERLFIQESSFISCSADYGGCFYLTGISLNMDSTCAMSNFANTCPIFYCDSGDSSHNNNLEIKSSIQCNNSHFDLCTNIFTPSESTSLFCNSESTKFCSNNISRCNVRGNSCSGCFSATYELKYSMNVNSNCTGSNYLTFSSKSHDQIESSIFYFCHSFNELKLTAAFLFSGQIVIRDFCFLKTQLNLFARHLRLENGDNDDLSTKIIFMNCIADLRKDFLQYRADYIVIDTFSFESTQTISLNYPDFIRWKCATDLLPKQTDFPTRSALPNQVDFNKKNPDNIKFIPNSTVVVLLYFGLTILILITLNICLIDYRRKRLMQEDSPIDDSSVLMDHTDYDASVDDYESSGPLYFDGQCDDLEVE